MPRSETDRVYDELLVTLVQAGDRRAGERLAARWQPRLLAAARRLLRDDDLARDAVQETWAGVLRGTATLSDPASFPAWAFGILRRRCVDLIRRAERRRRLSQGSTCDAVRPSGEDQAAIHQALGQLGFEQRTAAVLFFGEGLTLQEVAQATKAPVGTVKSRIFHARQRLKAALSGDSHG